MVSVAQGVQVGIDLPRTEIAHKVTAPDATFGERLLSGMAGSLVVSGLVTPLDVAKVRLQSQPSVQTGQVGTGVNTVKCTLCRLYVLEYSQPVAMQVWRLKQTEACFSFADSVQAQQFPMRTMRDAFRHIFRTEGVGGLYSGLAPTVATTIPSSALYLTAYEYARDALTEHMESQKSLAPGVAGASARSFAATAVSPLEMIRTRIQAGAKGGMVTLAREIVQSEGSAALFRGLGATLWRDVPFSALYWTGFEGCKKIALEANPSLGVTASFMAGAVAGGASALVTTPFDVVKTRHQVHFAAGTDPPPTLTRLLGDIYRKEGGAALMAGWSARTVKASAACSIMIGTYDFVKALIHSMRP